MAYGEVNQSEEVLVQAGRKIALTPAICERLGIKFQTIHHSTFDALKWLWRFPSSPGTIQIAITRERLEHELHHHGGDQEAVAFRWLHRHVKSAGGWPRPLAIQLAVDDIMMRWEQSSDIVADLQKAVAEIAEANVMKNPKPTMPKSKPPLQNAELISGGDVIEALTSIFPAMEAEVQCPACLKFKEDGIDSRRLLPQPIRVQIVHLNDDHKMPREAVADWLETLDVDIGFKAVEPLPMYDPMQGLLCIIAANEASARRLATASRLHPRAWFYVHASGQYVDRLRGHRNLQYLQIVLPRSPVKEALLAQGARRVRLDEPK